MLTILIVDDEKLERNGIKFLLKREKEEFRILEASNGKDALGVLMKENVDILFSDVKMPYINGLELSKQARELCPDLEIVIFSGYNDFSYAKEALRYGVVDYVLKPVDPEEFHRTLERVMGHISDRKEETEKQNRQEDYLRKYFFINYLYSGNKESLEHLEKLFSGGRKELDRCTRVILASASNGFFETEEEHFTDSLKEQFHRDLGYINLNSNESLFLFTEKYTDYRELARQLYEFFRKQYDCECYFAVSGPISEITEMPEEFRKLELLLGEQFYQPGQHVLVSGEEAEEPEDRTGEAELIDQISRDIRSRDVIRLGQDFGKLEKKYRGNRQFSEMYVKFVFSSILKEVYEQISPGDEKVLSKKVDRLYRCRKIQDVVDIVSKAISEFEESMEEQKDGLRGEIAKVKSYIQHHYSENNIGAEDLARMVYLSPGYLSTVFKEETGMTLNRYIREVRMNKARDLLGGTNMKITQIAKEVGFSNSSYFCRSFREYFGCSPESCRKGKVTDEEASSVV